MPPMGRPPDFQRRVRLTVFLEARELRAIRAAARAERLSASKWARRLLLAAVGIVRSARRRQKEH